MYCLTQSARHFIYFIYFIYLFILFIYYFYYRIVVHFILGIFSFRKIEYRDYFQNLPRNTNYSDILPDCLLNPACVAYLNVCL